MKVARARTGRRLFPQAAIGVSLLALVGLIATLLIRSRTGFSHFTRCEYCSLCGVEQVYHEVYLFDMRVLRSTSRYETGVSEVLRTPDHRRCGHCMNFVQQRMMHLSMNTTNFFSTSERGMEYVELLTHKKYCAALGAIHRTNAEIADLIWSHTVRNALSGNLQPLTEMEDVLEKGSVDEMARFLRTNRYFRPIHFNPEASFYKRSF